MIKLIKQTRRTLKTLAVVFNRDFNLPSFVFTTIYNSNKNCLDLVAYTINILIAAYLMYYYSAKGIEFELSICHSPNVSLQERHKKMCSRMNSDYEQTIAEICFERTLNKDIEYLQDGLTINWSYKRFMI